MSSKDVNFKIKVGVDGQGKVSVLKSDVEDLGKAFSLAQSGADGFRSSIININQATEGLRNAFSGLQQLSEVLQSYTRAAAAQEEVETKLATNMRNTMGARAEDIESIKALCSAQQRLGVIGDEVQMAGAQELATYLTKKQTLERLIPVMNDMIAQQYGLSATQESAANIATMLGKVMDGQVGALSRYGYKFDDVQEQVLRFGSEEERCAVLAEVVESAVGGMNEELGKTDAGKAKQAADAIGDIAENVGKMLAPFEQSIVLVGQLGMAFSALSQAGGGIVSLASSMWKLSAASKLSAFNSRLAASMMSWFSGVMGMTQMSVRGATMAVRGLTMAIRGLEIASVIGAAYVAFQVVLEAVSGSSDDASESVSRLRSETEMLKEVADAGNAAYSQGVSQLESYKSRLGALIDQQRSGIDVSSDEKKIVGELNQTYGQTMGYFKSVSEWYDTLVANSETYCQQLLIEAQMRQLANQYAEVAQEKRELWYDNDGKMKQGFTRSRTVKTDDWVDQDGRVHKGTTRVIEGTFEKAQKASRAYDSQLKGIRNSMEGLANQAARLKMPVVGAPTAPPPTSKPTPTPNPPTGTTDSSSETLELKENAQTWEELTNNVRYYEQQLKTTKKTDTAKIQELQALRDEAQAAADAIMRSGEEIESFDLGTIGGIEGQIRLYSAEQQTSDAEGVWALQQEIEALTSKKRVLEIGINLGSMERELSGLKVGERSVDELKSKVEELRDVLSQTDVPLSDAIRGKIGELISRYSKLISMTKSHSKVQAENDEKLKTLDGMSSAAAGIEQLAGSFQQLAGENKAFAGSMVVVGLAASISQLIAGMVKKANETTLTIWDWIAGVAAGTAAVVSAASSLKGIGVFANGGVVSGATLALVGEYAGASNNPEVIAPLDKLRSLLDMEGSGIGNERLEFKIRYGDLVAVLDRGNRKRSRS